MLVRADVSLLSHLDRNCVRLRGTQPMSSDTVGVEPEVIPCDVCVTQDPLRWPHENRMDRVERAVGAAAEDRMHGRADGGACRRLLDVYGALARSRRAHHSTSWRIHASEQLRAFADQHHRWLAGRLDRQAVRWQIASHVLDPTAVAVPGPVDAVVVWRTMRSRLAEASAPGQAVDAVVSTHGPAAEQAARQLLQAARHKVGLHRPAGRLAPSQLVWVQDFAEATAAPTCAVFGQPETAALLLGEGRWVFANRDWAVVAVDEAVHQLLRLRFTRSGAVTDLGPALPSGQGHTAQQFRPLSGPLSAQVDAVCGLLAGDPPAEMVGSVAEAAAAALS